MISIHALREESDRRILPRRLTALISIHALREESDQPAGPDHCRAHNFYPRSP